MKVKNLVLIIYLLFNAMLMVGCNNIKDDSHANYDESDVEEDPTEEYVVAKYSLTFRGETTSWTDENIDDADFSLHQVPTEKEGYYSMTISMGNSTASSSQSRGVTFSGLIGDKNMATGTISTSYSLIQVHTYAEEMECFDNPQTCIGSGTAIVSGTEPSEGALPGADNDIHSQSGKLTITSFTITENEGGILKGVISGNFSLDGINTNGSKPKPGSASGSFENAPFETLAFNEKGRN